MGLTVGVSPNIDFLKSATADPSVDIDRGVLVDEYLTTSNPDIYAIGDCAQLRAPQAGRRPIEAIWYTGRMMGQTVARTICGQATKYVPKLWFNSAKFLDIEYQVYGDVPTRVPEGIKSLYWEHESGKMSIRINFDAATKAVKGFNLMGIRYRHEVCEKWILNNISIESVLSHLSMANFDPEFFKMYESALVQQYNRETNSQLQLKSTRSLDKVLSFLRS